MFLLYFSIALTVLANLFYHVFQKSISATVNPIVSLIITYLTALVISFLVLPFYPAKAGITDTLKELNWASFALGFAIIGLEMGFLLAYRAGWNISLAAVISNVAVTLLLIPIGLLFFRERVTLINMVGIVLCIAGLVFVNQK